MKNKKTPPPWEVDPDPSFSFEDDPNCFWWGDPWTTICNMCLNRLPNGECEEHNERELGDAIQEGHCPDFLKKEEY